MQKIHKIGVKSSAKVLGLVLFLLGLINSVILIMFALLGSIGGTQGASLGGSFLIIIAFPFLYGLLGLVIGAVVSVIYNLIAGRFGGIEIELG